MRSRLLIAALATAAAITVSLAPVSAASGTVSVVYAGSLVGINENVIGPAFQQSSGYGYAGQGLGSVAIANELKEGLITPDAVEFADAAVNKLLMGKANGRFVKWYATFGRSRLVIGYDPAGRFARWFKRAASGAIPWYRPLLARGLRLGRTDPQVDPKGYRTLFAFRLAEKVFHLRGLTKRVLGEAENTSQVYPEQVLVSRLAAGEIDAGVFYLSEVKTLGIPYINLPARIDYGEPRFRRLYASQSFTNDQGQVFKGSPILYTVTIPKTVQDLPGATAFVKFVLSRRARALATGQGLLPVKPVFHGNKAAIPSGV